MGRLAHLPKRGDLRKRLIDRDQREQIGARNDARAVRGAPRAVLVGHVVTTECQPEHEEGDYSDKVGWLQLGDGKKEPARTGGKRKDKEVPWPAPRCPVCEHPHANHQTRRKREATDDGVCHREHGKTTHHDWPSVWGVRPDGAGREEREGVDVAGCSATGGVSASSALHQLLPRRVGIQMASLTCSARPCRCSTAATVRVSRTGPKRPWLQSRRSSRRSSSSLRGVAMEVPANVDSRAGGTIGQWRPTGVGG